MKNLVVVLTLTLLLFSHTVSAAASNNSDSLTPVASVWATSPAGRNNTPTGNVLGEQGTLQLVIVELAASALY